MSVKSLTQPIDFYPGLKSWEQGIRELSVEASQGLSVIFQYWYQELFIKLGSPLPKMYLNC